MLFNQLIFGPVKSRRFGASLGVNLLPTDSKLCNFECIYCECGWSEEKRTKVEFADREQLVLALRDRLIQMKTEGVTPDSITFAGNGEPTMHPEFAVIIEDVIHVRDQFATGAKIVVLTNALLADRVNVRRGLMLADRRILKLDAGDSELFRLINAPNGVNAFQKIKDTLESYAGQIEIQSLFLKAQSDGQAIDNTNPHSVAAWIKELKQIKPLSVQLYSVDREAPLHSVKAVDKATLQQLAERVRREGISAEVF
jgi:wyosine [tRNA(Phe)-imidazoG37] synthetase (radical SAM superfamily)